MRQPHQKILQIAGPDGWSVSVAVNVLALACYLSVSPVLITARKPPAPETGRLTRCSSSLIPGCGRPAMS
jgi:hypothetical protein